MMKKLFLAGILILTTLTVASAQKPLLEAGDHCYLITVHEKTFSSRYKAFFDLDQERIDGMGSPELNQKFNDIPSVSSVVNFMLDHGFDMVDEEYRVDKGSRFFCFLFRKNKIVR